MIIDLAVLGLLLFFTVSGIYQGLVPQLFRIGALVLVWLLVKPLGTVFSLLFWPFGIRGLTGYYLGVLVGAVVVYGVLSLLGRYLSDRFINTRTSRMELHSKLGGYLGFIKGLLVVVLVLFLLGSLPDGYLDKKPRMGAAIRGSWTVTLANLVNPFPRLTFFDDLSAYHRLLRDPAAVERLKGQPAFQQLREQQAVKVALADPEVARKLEELDYRYLLADPKVAPLLWDPEVRRLLLQLDPRKALEAPPPPPAEVAPEGEAAPAVPSVLEPTREVPPAEGQPEPEPPPPSPHPVPPPLGEGKGEGGIGQTRPPAPAGQGQLPSSPGAAPGGQKQAPPTE